MSLHYSRLISRAAMAVVIVACAGLGGCSYLEADSCEESVSGCPDNPSEPEKLQQLIDFCENYPDRKVCKDNNLGQ